MASGPFSVACRQLGRLFGTGTVAGLAEGPLLDRFVARRDAAAFEAIVARHGPMVLAVCRSLLRDPNDVDDAFQATFLVLVRKADTLRHRDSLGGWLHAVANRVARRALYEAGRRRGRESRGAEPGRSVESEVERLDVRAAVHAEVDRLPESYRATVLLCDLQGRTHEEAARELGWPVGTVKGRLARARRLLRDRLARRGLAPASVALLALLADEGRAAVPPALLESTASAASAIAAGPLAIAGPVSARVFDLTQGVLPTMTTTATKLKLAATLVVVGALAGPGASAYQFVAPATPTQTPSTPAPPAETKPGATDSVFSAEARVRLAQQAINMLNEQAKGAEIPPKPEEMLRWQRRLAEAKIDAGIPRAEALALYFSAVNEATNRAKLHDGGGPKLAVGLLDAEFRQLEPSRPSSEPRPVAAPAQPPGAPPAPIPAAGGGGFGGGGMVDDRPPRIRRQHPADIERNTLIEERLGKAVAMKFANETPLEDVLKHVKEQTKDDKGKGIPIYVDPIGIQNTEKTLQSPVTVDLEDVPLRTTLRLILAQLGMDYRVRDGMLYISDADSLEDEDHFILPNPSDSALQGDGPQTGSPGGFR